MLERQANHSHKKHRPAVVSPSKEASGTPVERSGRVSADAVVGGETIKARLTKNPSDLQYRYELDDAITARSDVVGLRCHISLWSFLSVW